MQPAARNEDASGLHNWPQPCFVVRYTVRFYGSADKHGVTHEDTLWVIEHATTVLELREEPRKLLYIGFDTVGRPREVVVDHPLHANGEPVCIHADTLTPSYYEFL